MQYRRRKNRNADENRHNDRWLVSYADLVTLLLALFIVLYAASDRERAAKIVAGFADLNASGDGVLPGTSSDEKNKTGTRILENPILLQKTKMRQTERGLVISLSEAGFFAPGDASVSPEAESVIKEIADSLNDSQTPIRVEGHTDSTPISSSRYPSNWELSTARASAVLARLLENGIAPARLSAAGYGGFQPLADNESADGRAQNRRVDIVVLNR